MKGVIIGGGIIGLSIARQLYKLGYDITVVEKRMLGRGASWAAGGMLAPLAEGLVGDFLDFCLESRDMYKSFVEEIQKETGDNVGFWECGIIYPVFSEEEKSLIQKRIKYYNKLGHNAIWLDRKDIEDKGYMLGKSVLGGAYFPDDKQVDNRRLITALVMYIKKTKIEVRQFETVRFINEKNGVFKSVTTDKGEIEADFCILAAGAWSGELEPLKVFPKKGQMFSFKTKKKEELKNILYSKRAYIIPRKDTNLVVVGATEENVFFKEGVTVAGLAILIKGLLDTLPNTKDYEIVETWYGFRPATPDGFPILGKSDIKNLYYATGHYRNGILLTPITAKIMADLIHKEEESPYLKIFSFDRFKHLMV
ncbi:glycine oxidase ThiO [Sulfurihydrogenibium sp.]|uniref:glycine oxidase ThiO n=1 Tax=Sulfurihydrogenibium sp. TaxID=2053621 RepID=UPI002633DFB0|nr:glycine oxidase ThiO [Sulfurihydrogenibium sp.]